MNPSTFGPVSVQVTLSASGAGTATFQATGQNITIQNLAVKCSTATLEATANVYKNQIGDIYRIGGTFSGSSGDNNTDPIPLMDGERIYVVWTGGDVGAIASVTVSGIATIGSGGFRAV
jgi:hypothetical protein